MTYKVLGTTTEKETCECCGKTGLKKVVALETPTGDIVHFGTDCAALAALGRKSASNRKLIERDAWAMTIAQRIIKFHGVTRKAASGIAGKTGYGTEVHGGVMWMNTATGLVAVNA